MSGSTEHTPRKSGSVALERTRSLKVTVPRSTGPMGPKVPDFNWAHKHERDKARIVALFKLVERQSAIIPSYSRFFSSPLFIPERWPLSMVFLRLIFSQLVQAQEQPGSKGSKAPHDMVPYLVFERCVMRIFKALGIDDASIDLKKYQSDANGHVGWQGFCRCWRDSKMAARLGIVERLYLCFDPLGGGASKVSFMIAQIVLVCIALSVSSFVVGTLPEFRYIPETCSFCLGPGAPSNCKCEPQPYEVFHIIELVCVVVFSIELVMRFATCSAAKLELYRNDDLLEALCTDDPDGPTSSRLNRVLIFVQDWSNILDFFAILPFYFDMLGVGDNLMVLRLLRISRAFRILRRGKLQYAQQLVGETLEKSKMSMYMVTFYLMLGILMSSCLVYFSEMGEWDEDKQAYMWPNKYGGLEPSPFTSIPETFWWTIVTVTAVGYGDYQPSTPMGKFFGSVTIIAGAIVFAMPIGIISSNFTHVWSEHEKKEAEDVSGEQSQWAILEVLNSFGMDGRTQVRFEIWDYDGSCDEPEFLGCAALDLAILGVQQEAPFEIKQELPLMKDFTRSQRSVQGFVTVHLKWMPNSESVDSPKSAQPRSQSKKLHSSCSAKIVEVEEAVYSFMDRPKTPQLKGQLTVDVVSARNLLNLDSKGKTTAEESSDPFVHVILCPEHSSEHLTASHVSWDTAVIDDCLNPVWNAQQTFAVDWTERGQQALQSQGQFLHTPEEIEQLASEDALEFPAQRILELQQAIANEIKAAPTGTDLS